MHRSRLAEAYFKSLALPGFEVSSSGVEALVYTPHQKSVFTNEVVKHHPELKSTFNPARTQTSTELLEEQDVVVCLDKSVFEDAIRWYGLDSRKTQVWHVTDIDRRVHHVGKSLSDWPVVAGFEEDIFQKIRRECNKLAAYLTSTSWVDIVDGQNKSIGMRLPIAWANDRGLWHRGCHVVVVTADGKFVVEKRSKNVVFAPGLLDITLGGGIDSGETPLQAAVRETHEELGVHVSAGTFKPLFIKRWTSYHPHYKKLTRCFLYTYFVQLPASAKTFTPQLSEVESLAFLSERQVVRLLRIHRLKHIGRLQGDFVYMAKAVTQSRQHLK